MDYKTLKGTKDYSPDEQILINEIISKLKKVVESFGFRPLDTPILEYFELLSLKYDKDAEILSEIFQLKDRGERLLGLRYDLTTSLFRYVSMNRHLKKPFKRYQIGKVFRDGPIKKGRSREFIQFDADVITSFGSIEGEAEILCMFYNAFLELNIEPVIEINNIKILEGALLSVGIDDKKLISSIILSIDKIKKIGKENVLKEIESKLNGFLEIKDIESIINLLLSNNLDFLEKKISNPIFFNGIKELRTLISFLKNLKINYQINLTLSRGLDIYTGNIWEAYDKKNIVTSSIGAGGRYDKITEFSGLKELSAYGVSFGILPIFEILSQTDNLKKSNIDILVVPLKKELFLDALKLANKKRKEGFNVDISYFYNLKKSFQYADYLNIKYLIILGEKDLKKNQYTIKNLKTKEERKEILF